MMVNMTESSGTCVRAVSIKFTGRNVIGNVVIDKVQIC